MNIKVLVVEDNPVTAQDIDEMLSSRGMTVVGHARNAQQAINKARDLSPDVIIMDINLDGETDGIDTVQTIYKTDEIPVVYLTANTDEGHVSRAYSTNPSAFIAKPFEEKDLVYAIELAFLHHNPNELAHSKVDKAIFLRTGDKYEKVAVDDILYIEADGSYSKVKTKEKEYSITVNLQSLSKRISHRQFVRIHRSYIVNVHDITGFDQNHVFIDDVTLPYSKTHREELMSCLHKL